MGEPQQGGIVIVSGPSGVGMDTFLKLVMELNDRYELVPVLRFGVIVTTRQPCPGDKTANEFSRYVDEASFQRLIDGGDLIEFTTFAGNRYGSLRPENGSITLLEIEVEGASNIAQPISAKLIFLTAPGDTIEDQLAVIAERLCAREPIAPDVLQSRLDTARVELVHVHRQSDLVIVNDYPDTAAFELLEVLRNHFIHAHA